MEKTGVLCMQHLTSSSDLSLKAGLLKLSLSKNDKSEFAFDITIFTHLLLDQLKLFCTINRKKEDLYGRYHFNCASNK